MTIPSCTATSLYKNPRTCQISGLWTFCRRSLRQDGKKKDHLGSGRLRSAVVSCGGRWKMQIITIKQGEHTNVKSQQRILTTQGHLTTQGQFTEDFPNSPFLNVYPWTFSILTIPKCISLDLQFSESARFGTSRHDSARVGSSRHPHLCSPKKPDSARFGTIRLDSARVGTSRHR